MQSPNKSDGSSQNPKSRRTFSSTQLRRIITTQSSYTSEPRSNPHESFLERTKETCPKHLTDSQQNKWLKTAKKAKQNFQLVRQLPPFHWPTSHYHQPIFLHHQTPHSIIESTFDKIRDVTIYVIDTESDPATQFRRETLPALIQIEAIHHEDSSTVIVIETQLLPAPSTYTFILIQQLCYRIFSA